MHVLLVLEQRSVQRRDQLLRMTLAQRIGTAILDHQQLEPIDELGGRGLLLQILAPEDMR
jgi:hypothetical protein